MPLDLAQCEIRTPSGPARDDLYRMLGEVFAADRPLFERLRQSGRPIYTWTPYTLYRGHEILGNVSLMPMRVWLSGRSVEVAGVGSVATAPQCRRQGVARHLLRHCLGVVDEKRLPAVLFTSQPEVYAGCGFTCIPQNYSEWRVSDGCWTNRGLSTTRLDAVTAEDWAAMAALYDGRLPNYDGKLVRDAGYWEFYQTLFVLNPNWHIVACREAGTWLGYARCEEEAGRLLLSEFCGSPERQDVTESLVGSIVERARRLGRTTVSLALAPGHFLERVLRSLGAELTVEAPGAGRETFMVRPGAGQSFGVLAQLQWSLADKF